MKILAFPAFSNKETNPYQYLLYTNIGAAEIVEFTHRRALFEKFDIFHVHWPDIYIRDKKIFSTLRKMIIFLGLILWLRLRGVKIVWTVHNLIPHDSSHPKTTQHFMLIFINLCHGLIFLSQSSLNAFNNVYKIPDGCHVEIIQHGHYRDVYPAEISKQDSRQKLGLPEDKSILLFFGMIKPYKNVIKLIEQFKKTNNEDFFLLIAGSASPEMKHQVQQAANKAENIRTDIEFVTNDKVSLLFSASDLVVLPFKNILNSGSLILALSFNRPVLAPALGSLIELRDEAGDEWVHLYEGDFSAEHLNEAISNVKKETSSEIRLCSLDMFSWEKLGERTRLFYQTLLN